MPSYDVTRQAAETRAARAATRLRGVTLREDERLAESVDDARHTAMVEAGRTPVTNGRVTMVTPLTMAEQLERDNAALRAAVARAQEVVAELREIVELIELADPTDSAPEDYAVLSLCEKWGYGAVMDAAARLWARKDDVGAKTVGPCRGTVRSALGGNRG